LQIFISKRDKLNGKIKFGNDIHIYTNFIYPVLEICVSVFTGMVTTVACVYAMPFTYPSLKHGD
jgi:hypothetical protein